MTEAKSVRYATNVIQVGPLVTDFLKQGIVILFGEGAPQELLEFCALHRPEVRTGGIRAGDQIRMDEHTMTILSVGDVADANLKALGHISVKANGEHVAPLPGDVCVEKIELPELREGSRIEIVAGQPAESEATS
jgi:glucitol/sorbitol PTS system EIIA component